MIPCDPVVEMQKGNVKLNKIYLRVQKLKDKHLVWFEHPFILDIV